nr:MAG TPA: hypothetical protein [Caudoviricetes sp.]
MPDTLVLNTVHALRMFVLCLKRQKADSITKRQNL